jgi:hypothetical protein
MNPMGKTIPQWWLSLAIWYIISLIFLVGCYLSLASLHYFPHLYSWWIDVIAAIPTSLLCRQTWTLFKKAERRWVQLAPAFHIEGLAAMPLIAALVMLGLEFVMNTAYVGWLAFLLGGVTAVFGMDRILRIVGRFRNRPPTL